MTIKFKPASKPTFSTAVLQDGELIGFVLKYQKSFTGMQRGGVYTYWDAYDAEGAQLTGFQASISSFGTRRDAVEFLVTRKESK